MSTNKIRSIQTAGTMLTLASLILCLMPHAAVLTTAESRSKATGADVSALPEKSALLRIKLMGANASPNVVLSSRFAELHLADVVVLGSDPTGPSVRILWPIVFKNPAIMNNYKQYLKITDDAGLTTGFDQVGSWSVSK